MIRRILREAIRNVLSEASEHAEEKIAQYGKRGLNLDLSVFNTICCADPTSSIDTESPAGKCFEWMRQNGAEYNASDSRDMGYIAGKYFDWLYQHYDELNDGGSRVIEQVKDGLKILSRTKGMNIQQMSVEDVIRLNTTLEYAAPSWTNKLKKLQGQFLTKWSNNDWIIIHPLTWDAERYFGQHTSWCTVAEEDKFEEYGNIYIVIPCNNGIPDVESSDKWQISDVEGYVCMANSQDDVFYSMPEFFAANPSLEDKDVANALFQIDNNFITTNTLINYYVQMGVPNDCITIRHGIPSFSYNGLRTVTDGDMKEEMQRRFNNMEPMDEDEKDVLEMIYSEVSDDFFDRLQTCVEAERGHISDYFDEMIRNYFTDPMFLYDNGISYEDIINCLKGEDYTFGELMLEGLFYKYEDYYTIYSKYISPIADRIVKRIGNIRIVRDDNV